MTLPKRVQKTAKSSMIFLVKTRRYIDLKFYTPPIN